MTLYLLSERILRLYEGGAPSTDTGIKIEDIKRMVIDQINLLLKTETITLEGYDGNPTNFMLARYENIAVSSGITAGGITQSTATLPAVPVSLPMQAGVWRVEPNVSSIAREVQFIPLQYGQWSLIKDFSPLVVQGQILGNYTYEVVGTTLLFPSDISSTVTHINITLVVGDIANYGDFDLLPMPADYGDQVVRNVLTILGVVPPVEDSADDGNKQK